MHVGATKALIAILLLAPSALPAQDTTTTARQSIAGLHPRLRVRLQFQDGSIATGRLALSGDTVALYTYYGSWHSFAVDSVARVWREGPSSAGAGFKQGAIVGAAIGALVFVAIGSAFCHDPDSSNGCTVGGLTLAGVFGGAVGGLVGGVLGAIIGALIPSWQPVFPTP